MSDYRDFGPMRDRQGNVRRTYANRPHCEWCGPFRGRYIRTTASGETKCRGCDEEDEN